MGQVAVIVALLVAGILVPWRWLGWLVDLVTGRRRRARPAPAGRVPIERLAADLRRLHAEAGQTAVPRSHVQRVAARLAYDDLLVEACGMLGLDTTGPPDEPAEERRHRLAAALAAAGLAVPGQPG